MYFFDVVVRTVPGDFVVRGAVFVVVLFDVTLVVGFGAFVVVCVVVELIFTGVVVGTAFRVVLTVAFGGCVVCVVVVILVAVMNINLKSI